MTDAEPDVGALLDAMTLDEKVAQLGTVRIGDLLDDGALDRDAAADLLADGIGRVTRVGRESDLSPERLATVIAAIQRYLREETRLGVPAGIREESVCGYAGRGGTPFPQRIGLAATWNPALVRAIDRRIARQLAAVGCTVTLSPVADLGVEPRWGRTEETYGEDPYLAARLCVASVRGLQGPGPVGVDDGLVPAAPADASHGPQQDPTGTTHTDASVQATLKHFAAHGRPAGGRNRADVSVSRRTLRDADFVPFRAGVASGDAASVMAAYHAVDGVPCHASRWLLTDVLREEWGFTGTVVSDGRGIDTLVDPHGVAADEREAGIRALRAGVDIELPETACFGDRLGAAVRDGTVAEAVVDRAVRRHLREKVRAGLLDPDRVAAVPTDVRDADGTQSNAGDDADSTRAGAPASEPELEPIGAPGDASRTDEAAIDAAFDPGESRWLARTAARQSITLLSNRGDLLPLSLSADATVAVVGPNADAPRNQLGNYAYGGGLGTPAPARDVVTPLDGLRERLGDERVTHAPGPGVRPGPDDEAAIADAAAVADAAEVAVVCVGGQSGIDVEIDSQGTAGEALDRTTLSLPGAQTELVAAVAETGTPTVAVLLNGRPLAVPSVVETADATLEAWLPGAEGGRALATVLSGAADPGGRLPVTLPRSVGHLPVHYRQSRASLEGSGYVFTDAAPLFPFGHGESYAAFAYGDVTPEADTVAPDGTIDVTVTVTNVSDRAGEDVVQVYASDPLAERVRPIRWLVGFRRLHLDAGETATVRVGIPVRAVGYPGSAGTRVVEPGEIRLSIGRSAGDLRGSATVVVEGDEPRHVDEPPALATTTVSRRDTG